MAQYCNAIEPLAIGTTLNSGPTRLNGLLRRRVGIDVKNSGHRLHYSLFLLKYLK
jgi:hypothetical protein